MAKAEYRSAQRSRQLIKTALADLLQEMPLDKITVTDVVTRAGINRSTFYVHYANIPDVIDHLVEDAFLQLQDTLSEAPGSLHTIAEVTIRQVQSILEEDLDFYRKLMSEPNSDYLTGRLCQVMTDYFLEHESVFSNLPHEEYVFRVRFSVGGVGSLYRDWFAGLLPMTLTQLTEHSITTLSRMMNDNAPL